MVLEIVTRNGRGDYRNPGALRMLIEAIRNGSVATWPHFNLHEECDFSDERMVDLMSLTSPKNPDLE